MSVPTPHLEAKLSDIAETVLMPGDPKRAKFIAETYLENAVLYNSARGMLGFTGTYKGKRISVQGSGMGIPSMGIYSYELFNFYNVQNIIRVGTAGGIHPELHIGDIVIGMGACTDSDFARQYGLSGSFAPIADYKLLETAIEETRRIGKKFMTGNVLSSDVFYSDNQEAMGMWRKMGVLAVEMEAAGLYMNAARAGKSALAIMTVSDCIFTGESTTSKERETAFTGMMEIALETAVRL